MDMETTTKGRKMPTKTDTLMDIAQEALVAGKTHDETVAILVAQGTDMLMAHGIVNATESHPITKILSKLNR